MYTTKNINALYTYFDEISYTEKIINAKNNESNSINVSFSIDGLRSTIGEVERERDKAYIIKNTGDIQIDSNLFILRTKFTPSFDIVGVAFSDDGINSSNKKDFDDLILISFEEMRVTLNKKLNNLLKFTNFSPEEEYEFWESGQSFNKKQL